MPMIINSNGKAVKIPNIRKLIYDAATEHLNQLYEQLKMLEINQASHDELDRLAELYGVVRKYGL